MTATNLACPTCERAMDPVTLGTVVIDHCAGCSGIWFDEGELQAGLSQGGKRELRRLSATAEAPAEHDLKAARCPRCRSAVDLIRAPSPTEPDLHVDFCPECGGVWYDGGEVELLLSDSLGGRIGKFFKGLVGG